MHLANNLAKPHLHPKALGEAKIKNDGALDMVETISEQQGLQDTVWTSLTAGSEIFSEAKDQRETD